MEQPNYYAVIPADVRYDKELTPMAKLLYGEISALAQKEGTCWATNSYFAELYGVNNLTISRWISKLEKRGYISVEIVYKNGTKEIEKRVICIDKKISTPIQKNQEGIDEKINTPIDEKVKENNTSNNNTSNNKREILKRNTPTLEEVEGYIQEKGLNVNAKNFFEYFEEGGWVDSKGNKVRNWKQKLLTWNKFQPPKQEVSNKFHDDDNTIIDIRKYYDNF